MFLPGDAQYLFPASIGPLITGRILLRDTEGSLNAISFFAPSFLIATLAEIRGHHRSFSMRRLQTGSSGCGVR